MKIIVFLKREFRCADFRYIFVAILINFALGILSALLGGRADLYRYLLLPRFAPSPLVFVLIWSLLYILLGAAFGFVFAPCRSGGARGRLYAVLLYALLWLWMLLWYPIFFAARLYTLALVVAALILSTSFFVFRLFIKRSLFSGVLMLPCILWFAFAFVLNFCVILLNA